MSEHDKLAAAIKEREIELLRRDVVKLLKENWQLGIERDEARAEAKRFSKIADLMHIERDKAREEFERERNELKKQLADALTALDKAIQESERLNDILYSLSP